MPRLYDPEITVSLHMSANARSVKEVYMQDNIRQVCCQEEMGGSTVESRPSAMALCLAFRNTTLVKFPLAKSCSVTIL